MEPRPPKSTRPASNPPSHLPPAPPADRFPWTQAEQPPTAPSVTPSQARAAWQDAEASPPPSLGAPYPGPALTPVAAPRGERGSPWIGPLLAAVLLLVVIGGTAFAISRARDGGDQQGAVQAAQTATRSAEIAEAATAEAAIFGTAAAATSTALAEEAAALAATTTASAREAVPTEVEEEPTPPRTPTPTPRASSPRGVAAFLPSARDLPDGFVEVEKGEYSKADIAVQLGADGEQLLDEWRWRENSYRNFAIPEENDPNPRRVSFLSVSVHRFGSREGASTALDYLANVVASNPGYVEVEVERIGDQTRALANSASEANIYVLYVRSGAYVIRFGGSSVSGDPARDVIRLAERILDVDG